MMPVKNNVVVGMLFGLILPLLAYLFSEVFLKAEIVADKPGVPYLIAVGLNLILMRFLYKYESDKAGIGVFVVTFLTLLLAFIFKIKLR